MGVPPNFGAQATDPGQQPTAAASPFGHMPYSYETGSAYPSAFPGEQFGPNQAAGQQQGQMPMAYPTTQTGGVPMAAADDPGQASEQFASNLGAGVLAASQAGAKGGMMQQAMKKKKPGAQDGGDAGVGATPGSEGM